MTEYRKSKTPQHPLQALKRDSTSSLRLAADITVRLLGEENEAFSLEHIIKVKVISYIGSL